MPRDVDHVVIAVENLEAARASWQRLGFTVTPAVRYPNGVATAFVQFDRSFVELLTISEPERVPKAPADRFSLAGFNRDFLQGHQGISMLVLQSGDVDADRAEFEKQGLNVSAPDRVACLATGPDGVERQLSASMVFVGERRLREAAVATCRHDEPQNLWHKQYQDHRNGALSIASAVLVTRDPADFHEFFSTVSGQHDMVSTSLGVAFELGQSAIEILSPVGFHAFFGETSEPDPRRFLGLRISVADLDATRRFLDDGNVPYSEHLGTVVVPSSAANGVALVFVDEVTFSLSGRSVRH